MTKEQILIYLQWYMQSYKCVISNIKRLYLPYIQDKSIPLEDRWEIFGKVPQELKEHKIWIVHFPSEKKFGEICWYDDFYVERHETVNLIDLVRSINRNKWSQERIDAFKEDILQMNLGSFINDW